MFKTIISFIVGTLFGAYVMRNHIFKKAAMSIINKYEKDHDVDSILTQNSTES